MAGALEMGALDRSEEVDSALGRCRGKVDIEAHDGGLNRVD